MITFELFARPAILKMMGKPVTAKPTVAAVVEGPVVNTDGRRIFARARVTKRDGQYFAQITGPQGSGILTSMSQANGLVVVPEDQAWVDAGDTVSVMMLDWDEEG
jgi:molybdopterin molybdotransferase